MMIKYMFFVMKNKFIIMIYIVILHNKKLVSIVAIQEKIVFHVQLDFTKVIGIVFFVTTLNVPHVLIKQINVLLNVQQVV